MELEPGREIPEGSKNYQICKYCPFRGDHGHTIDHQKTCTDSQIQGCTLEYGSAENIFPITSGKKYWTAD